MDATTFKSLKFGDKVKLTKSAVKDFKRSTYSASRIFKGTRVVQRMASFCGSYNAVLKVNGSDRDYRAEHLELVSRVKAS